ncbi:cohesin domain-containing protein [Natrinema pallidum]|uniref:Cellulosome anchoring protein cohesin region n=1 Tax=Natrinema pallidum DSM 3751 TaxID=1227495 RepID=L9YNX7_9EURY|nr:cohesin domain-containing protein [Natrinema pallidum]ELY75157.1 cellulosome anchoring protein cohesin region [Natrinema pallidum DSM 3751]
MDTTRRDAGARPRDGSVFDSYRTVVRIGFVVCLAFALSVAPIAGTAAAIDQVAIVSPDRTQIEAAPGETVAIDVTLRSQGGHGGGGIDAVTLVAQYHPDYLEIEDVDRGSWLEGPDTTIRTAETLADERGTALLEQRREPAGDGATGAGTIVTLTVRVAEDAPAGTTTLSFDETEVETTGDWPIAVVDDPATIAIDGGTEPLESFDHPDPDELARDSTPSSEDEAESAATDGSESVPGFTAGLAIAAITLGIALVAAAADRRGG